MNLKKKKNIVMICFRTKNILNLYSETSTNSSEVLLLLLLCFQVSTSEKGNMNQYSIWFNTFYWQANMKSRARLWKCNFETRRHVDG
jgi:predicted membrane protein